MENLYRAMVSGTQNGVMMKPTQLTKRELRCINQLAKAWNIYSKLDALHASDADEFAQAIHVAQNIVMARIALRELAKG